MDGFDVLKYLYLLSCFCMAAYIIQNSEKLLINYGIQKLDHEREKKEGKMLSFTATMLFYVVISPILWLIIWDEKNKRK